MVVGLHWVLCMSIKFLHPCRDIFIGQLINHQPHILAWLLAALLHAVGRTMAPKDVHVLISRSFKYVMSTCQGVKWQTADFKVGRVSRIIRVGPMSSQSFPSRAAAEEVRVTPWRRVCDPLLQTLKPEEEGHEPRNAGSLWNTEKTRTWILSWSPWKSATLWTPCF